jgi:hypothetical protein
MSNARGGAPQEFTRVPAQTFSAERCRVTKDID